MKADDLASEIGEARPLVDELCRRNDELGTDENELVTESIEQLQTALEELRVAEEELRTQNAELIVTRDALEEERARYREMFELAPDAYLVTDPEGVIRAANEAAARLLGIQDRFLIGKPLANYVSDEERKSFRAKLNSILTSDRVIEIDARMQLRTGEHLDSAIRLAPVRNSKGELTGLRWLVRNVTERKQAEDEIKSWNIELERRVAERTAELEAAKAEAEAANRAKDDFLATLSHELRTPLNAILGWTHILATHLDNRDTAAQAIEVIERNAATQARLINEILEVSRIITGKLTLNLLPMEIGPIIEAAIEGARPAIDSKAIQLEVSLCTDDCQILGDATRLQQVVANLLSNAVKFTPEGGKISVELTRAGERAQLTVSDTGQGIDAEFLPFIFDRFRQAESASTRRHGGLGLGLAIVRHIVEMHGGTVQAASAGKGQGASFVVSLPVTTEKYLATVIHEQENAKHSAFADEPYHSLKGLRILVVDDEQDAREMLSVLLTQAGAEVVTAASCAETLALLAGEVEARFGARPDVLIADIAMPGGDGFDLIRGVRGMEANRGSRIPAIALTAYAGEEDHARALSEGYQMHIAKPVRLSVLAEAVARLVRGA
ncbi:MAG TPA: ATP-binding protein [Blastocatellia bacterium]|nr:ATP-binding protein [Blastocatellia bacterium]